MKNRNFSPEAKKIAKATPIVRVAELVPLTLKKHGAYYTFKEHDSVVIDPRRNCFWHNSQHISGDTIKLLQHFCGVSYAEAISTILDLVGENGESYEYLSLSYDFEHDKRRVRKFSMPEIATDKNGSVYTEDIEKYLTETRCISPKVVDNFIDEGRLYQQSIRMKNFTRGRFRSCCLFVGYPYGIPSKNEPNFCERRTIRPSSGNGKFKTLTVEGSDKKHGYYVNYFSKTMVITEGILDFMAIMSIIEKNGRNFHDFDYLALTGTGKIDVIANVLEEQPHIANVVLSFDNDEAGKIATKAALEMLTSKFPHICYTIKVPKSYKDYNDLLIAQTKDVESAKKTA